MKNQVSISILFLILISTACSQKQFEAYYVSPSKVQSSTVSKQYAGFLDANVSGVVPRYWAYFTSYLRGPSLFTQALGAVNAPSMYVVAAGVMDYHWGYYDLLFQYRQLEEIYKTLPDSEQKLNRVFMLTAAIYLYDFTQRTVNVYGDIPFSEAGKITQNSGSIEKSLPKYDKAEDIYTKILDDLKLLADELNTITIPPAIEAEFKSQDFLNGGDIDKWKKYCNTLRFRMLNTVSQADLFKARASSEMADILANPGKYPLVSKNDDSIHYVVITTGAGDVNSAGVKDALAGNIAGKKMMDYMNANKDPRRRVFFEPGAKASGEYIGLDPSLDPASQIAIIAKEVMAIVNRYVFTYNQKLPGEIINAAQTSFMLAEYYLRIGDDARAKTAYETGITQSINYYFWIANSSDSTIGAKPDALVDAEVSNYIVSPGVGWANANTSSAKMELIATQMWIHYGWMQLLDSWTDSRRMDRPALQYWKDTNPGSIIKLPPNRYLYSATEKQYNAANYEKVAGKDLYTTKIFWDQQDYREQNP